MECGGEERDLTRRSLPHFGVHGTPFDVVATKDNVCSTAGITGTTGPGPMGRVVVGTFSCLTHPFPLFIVKDGTPLGAGRIGMHTVRLVSLFLGILLLPEVVSAPVVVLEPSPHPPISGGRAPSDYSGGNRLRPSARVKNRRPVTNPGATAFANAPLLGLGSSGESLQLAYGEQDIAADPAELAQQQIIDDLLASVGGDTTWGLGSLANGPILVNRIASDFTALPLSVGLGSEWREPEVGFAGLSIPGSTMMPLTTGQSSFDVGAGGSAGGRAASEAGISFHPIVAIDDPAEGNLHHTPEPSALAIWSALGMVGFGVAWWRRRRRGAAA